MITARTLDRMVRERGARGAGHGRAGSSADADERGVSARRVRPRAAGRSRRRARDARDRLVARGGTAGGKRRMIMRRAVWLRRPWRGLFGLLRVLPAAGADALGRARGRRAPEQRPSTSSALALGVQAYVYGYPAARHQPRVPHQHQRQRAGRRGWRAGQPVQPLPPVHEPHRQDGRRAQPRHPLLDGVARPPPPADRHAHARRPAAGSSCSSCSIHTRTNFAAIGSVGYPPGNYAIVPPGWHGHLPHGVRRIRSPYTRVWVIGRTYIKDAADTPNVVRIQNQYSITPLNKWGTNYRPPRPRHPDRKSFKYTVPGTGPQARIRSPSSTRSATS